MGSPKVSKTTPKPRADASIVIATFNRTPSVHALVSLSVAVESHRG